jgi:DNA-binding response OmpR family regulator
LEQDEFCVIEAVDGLNALHLAITCRIDIVVTDFRMPQLDGLELVDRLNEMHPGLPVILMTGTDADEISNGHPELTVFSKPFDPHLLVAKIRESLDGSM